MTTDRDIALVKAALEAAADRCLAYSDGRYDTIQAELCADAIRVMGEDAAAIAAGVPECLSAMEQVALDLHDAIFQVRF